MTNTLLFFSFILLAFILGTKTKINIGLFAALFAFPLGILAGNLSANTIVSLFPTTLFLNFLCATFLFGFAGYNGTLKTLAAHLLYHFRNTGWALGLLFFLVTAIIAALGAGGSAPFFLSSICFSLALQAGINPLLSSLAVWTGSMVGGSVPWTSGYATNIGQLEIYFSPEAASSYVAGFYLWRVIFYTLLYLVMFFLLKGYRIKNTTVSLEKPIPFAPNQQKTIAIIFSIIAGIVLPAALKLLFPGPITDLFSRIFTFQFLSVLGIITNILFKTAPYEAVLKERIPWNTLLMLSLTGMYMGLANQLNIVDFMTHFLQNQIPPALIIPGIVLIMSILSFFVSGSVIIPMVLPLLPVFASASSQSVAAIYCAIQIGLTASSISPFSQGGAAALTGCSNESIRKLLLKQQTFLSFIFTIIVFLIALAGGFSMLHG